MKKFTFLVAALCATMMASAAVTFTGNAIGEAGTEGSGSLVEKTIDGVTLSIDKGYVKIDPKVDVNWIRAYSGAKMTISATSNISKIVITTTKPESSTKDKYSAAAFSASSYSVSSDKTVGTWTGSATSVTFSASAQVRMISVEVTLGEGGEGEGGGEEEGGEGGETEETVVENKTIAEFIANKGGKCYLTGAVGEIKNTTFGNFYLTDASGTIFVYGCLTADGQSKQFETLGVAQGDTLTVLASVYEVYQSQDQAKDVIYVSHKKATAIRTVEIDNTVYARDGRIYAEEGARIYSLTGLDVTRMNGNLEGIYIVKNGNKVAKVAVAK